MITAWRLLKTKYAGHAFDGEGARLYGGRWNSRGMAVVYCSATASLAALEILTNLQGSEILAAYSLLRCSFATSLVQSVSVDDLPTDWRDSPPPARLRHIGDEWLMSRGSAVLSVPSVVVPHEQNYLINPSHPDFRKIEIGTPDPFAFDARLVRP